MPLNQLLLAELDAEVQANRELLERLPDGQWDWKPHAKSMTLSRLATHVAEIPSWSNAIAPSGRSAPDDVRALGG